MVKDVKLVLKMVFFISGTVKFEFSRCYSGIGLFSDSLVAGFAHICMNRAVS